MQDRVVKVHLVSAYAQTDSVLSAAKALAAHDTTGSFRLLDTAHEADIILFTGTRYDGRLIRQHSAAQNWPKKCLVYDRLPNPTDTFPGVYVNMTSRGFDRQRMEASSYLDSPPMEVGDFPATPSSSPDLLFSFRGQKNVPVRDSVLSLRYPRGEVVDTTAAFIAHSSQNGDEEHRRAYRDQMMRSKFVLCPRGWGTSSYRMYETLAMGRVPVVLSDMWVPPTGPDWTKCILRVDEDQVASLPGFLESMEPRWASMSQAALEAWNQWFSPAVRFSRIVESCVRLQARRSTPEQFGKRMPSVYAISRWSRARREQLKRRMIRGKRLLVNLSSLGK